MASLDVWTVEVPLRVALFHLDICFRKNLNGWKSYQETKLLFVIFFFLVWGGAAVHFFYRVRNHGKRPMVVSVFSSLESDG